MQMANKHLKWCSTSLVKREIQIKTTKRNNFTTIIMAIIKRNVSNKENWKKNVTPSFLSPSVQLSRSVMSDSLWPHELRHAGPPCPLPSPGVYSNSCALSWWCHPTILSSVVPFSSHLQSFPSSGSFQKTIVTHIWGDWLKKSLHKTA